MTFRAKKLGKARCEPPLQGGLVVAGEGLIAQEVQKTFPELVRAEGDASGILSINHIELIPVVVSALREQDGVIKQHQAKIKQPGDRIPVLGHGREPLMSSIVPETSGRALPLECCRWC